MTEMLSLLSDRCRAIAVNTVRGPAARRLPRARGSSRQSRPLTHTPVRVRYGEHAIVVSVQRRARKCPAVSVPNVPARCFTDVPTASSEIRPNSDGAGNPNGQCLLSERHNNFSKQPRQTSSVRGPRIRASGHRAAKHACQRAPGRKASGRRGERRRQSAPTQQSGDVIIGLGWVTAAPCLVRPGIRVCGSE